jgi:hypothetical protein
MYLSKMTGDVRYFILFIGISAALEAACFILSGGVEARLLILPPPVSQAG